MNQFSNIGSILPGAEHKLTRDKAKHILTVSPTYQITGLVMTTPGGDKCIVDSSAVRWLTKEQSWEIMHNADAEDAVKREIMRLCGAESDLRGAMVWLQTHFEQLNSEREGLVKAEVAERASDEQTRCWGIAQAEYLYWEKVCSDDPGGYGIEGMGAATNIVASITMGYSVEEHNAAKTNIERQK